LLPPFLYVLPNMGISTSIAVMGTCFSLWMIWRRPQSFFKIAGPPEHLSIVLKELERKHPYTKGISQFIIILYNLTCILEECIHLWDGNLEKWELIEPFDIALDHSIPVEFELDWKNNLVLNILTVSLNFNCKC